MELEGCECTRALLSMIRFDHCPQSRGRIEWVAMVVVSPCGPQRCGPYCPNFVRVSQHMPVFEFECRGCGHRFEYLILRSSPEAECPAYRQKDQLLSLFVVSSDPTEDASVRAAHRKAGTVQKEKVHQDHAHLHKRFENKPAVRSPGNVAVQRRSHAHQDTQGCSGNR
jgi:putative FmdB family regulatory protein